MVEHFSLLHLSCLPVIRIFTSAFNSSPLFPTTHLRTDRLTSTSYLADTKPSLQSPRASKQLPRFASTIRSNGSKHQVVQHHRRERRSGIVQGRLAFCDAEEGAGVGACSSQLSGFLVDLGAWSMIHTTALYASRQKQSTREFCQPLAPAHARTNR
jgi:hypothetical protein